MAVPWAASLALFALAEPALWPALMVVGTCAFVTFTIALMADEDAWRAFEEMAPDGFINEACARIGIRMDKCHPIGEVGKIRCPVLLIAADNDISLPGAVVDKAAGRLGRLAEVRRYPIGHFDIYRGDSFEAAVREQVAFFSKHLLGKSQG